MRFAASLLIWMIISAPVMAAQSGDDNHSTPETLNLYIMLYPPQLEMHGPMPFTRHGSQYRFSDLGMWTSLLGAAAAGVAIDTVIALGSTRPAIMRMLQSTKMLGQEYDYRGVVTDGFDRLVHDTWFQVSDIEYYKFGNIGGKIVRWIFDNSDADYIMFLDTDFFIVEDLDRLCLIADIDVYQHYGSGRRSPHVINRQYEYLSYSRGDLFRPWDEGEREALISMIEEDFEFKVSRFPQNVRAYRKDRNGVLRALRGRDVILPSMATFEGWSDASLDAEIRRATAYVMNMIRRDLQNIGVEHDDDVEYNRINILSQSGKTARAKGLRIDQLEEHTIYQTSNLNMYALPADFEIIE